MPPQYKFVEVSPVTGEALEAAVNEWVGKGWQLENIRFVVPERATRPHLAFVELVTPATSPGPPLGEALTSHGEPVHEAPPVEAPPDAPGQAASVITAPREDEVE